MTMLIKFSKKKMIRFYMMTIALFQTLLILVRLLIMMKRMIFSLIIQKWIKSWLCNNPRKINSRWIYGIICSFKMMKVMNLKRNTMMKLQGFNKRLGWNWKNNKIRIRFNMMKGISGEIPKVLKILKIF
jgi:hypothetical protein